MNITRLNNETIRALERTSIRRFMERNQQYLVGRVLDYGAGTQPYRDLVAGEYVPYEKGESVPGLFDAVMCNQVIQYVRNLNDTLDDFWELLKPQGYLVLTGPTNWPEVEESDLQRLTLSGICRLLNGFRVLTAERRAEIDLNGFKLSLGYGVIAQKP